ncbi:PEP-CTERM sorting domain-containing protein [Massilia sp. G4R7]|uniref:PEP-CTERM sorting domain-containing protein n=1 Tax=Massilia phyllostachyos TaxID=2898585 RepID=A0ABS8Q8Q3_9BURK|nr:PEP-CTERM sorting domain-containing protein [Massilia phyllostachyos]MCD2518151.1 PEP-CTERM sorting domain-containing protein [Massilia phyllostachyos]
MKLTKLFAFAGALTLSCAANAALLSGSTGSNAVTNWSSAGAVAFDLDLANFSATRITFTLEEDDLLGPLSFDALVRNYAGAALSRFTFSLQGIRFAAPAGTVTPSFGSVGSIDSGAGAVGISFASPEYAEFQFGDVFGDAGAADWLLDTSGLRAGDTFTISATVPEPSSAALVLPMLCMAGLMAARRRKKD